ncbi:sulfotransferase family protein [Arthrospira platensis]|uniref:sulfotransferase family protein n=1 Tax=Limnospira TaxID=2596745 RepID=UPI0001C38C50|nr:sulfotransferase [Arthrospira platensis]AMW26620.1 hypothetical protein AP285_00025 [Arthrospira platensis YZ]MBD2671322.1 sulfotransferase [Arthrospira platensis FACHB-439]MBD2712255.1 sulfotransferase [Arthrospira platensis FACHB-835]MDT9297223.1 sulfotransferase [Arthrospira platensis PCC 7345]MDT9312586.1 sulfotransferase [Limnospira sp. Paracas R14]QQW29382.1 sulfotransferase [Arthrospira sp. PCC 9108]
MNQIITEAINWSNTHQPVFVVGAERSGTSIVFRTIAAHPAFIDSPFQTMETFVFVHPDKLIEGKIEGGLKIYLGGEPGIKQYRDSIQELIILNQELDGKGLPRQPRIYQNKSAWQERRYRDIIVSMFFQAWNRFDQKRLVEKTPKHLYFIPEIIDCFPQAKILICSRHPLGVIVSHRRRYQEHIKQGKNPDSPDLAWLNKDVSQYIRAIQNVDKLTQNMMDRFPNHTFLVSYEKFTSQAEETGKAIFSFIGEEFTDEVLDKPKSLKNSNNYWDILLDKKVQYNDYDPQKYLTEEEINLVKRSFE